jgi:DNA-binding NarL/FixJ family response regulator
MLLHDDLHRDHDRRGDTTALSWVRTCFRLTAAHLPAHDGDRDHREQGIEVMRPTYVALVDPQPVFRAGVRSVLEETGRYRVVAQASSGLAVGELCRSHDVELVLLPVRLPGLPGLLVAELLNRQQPTPRIVFLSNDGSAATRRSAAWTGAAAFLPRDVAILELIRTLDRVVAGEDLLRDSWMETGAATGETDFG